MSDWLFVCLTFVSSEQENPVIFVADITCIWSNIAFQKLITGKMEKIDWSEINEFAC